MHPALEAIRDATVGTPFAGDLFLVGGAVRDELLGGGAKDDYDLVTLGSSAELAMLLYERGLAEHFPVTYEQFGTAMVHVLDTPIELVTARRESYSEESRKPVVESASYLEDAQRRDFTVNTLMRGIHDGQLRDPLGVGLRDLQAGVLRTPLDPVATFTDDPLRMLRAVRFRWKLGFEPAPGLYEAIRQTRDRLRIVSAERIRDEFLKILTQPSASDALADLMALGLFEVFFPELTAMVGVEQGHYHHLDVWDHTRLVVANTHRLNPAASSNLLLGALLHDVGKPSTRLVDAEGNTRFFTHEAVGAEMTKVALRRLKFSEKEILAVAKLVKNHMRLGSSPTFSSAAARRLIRDLGDQVPDLLTLVEADTLALRPGLVTMDLEGIRERLEQVQVSTPRASLECPLSGLEIMDILQISPGPEVRRLKEALTEMVLEGSLRPGDREAAIAALRAIGDGKDSGAG